MRVRDCWNPLGMGGGRGKEVREGWEEETFMQIYWLILIAKERDTGKRERNSL